MSLTVLTHNEIAENYLKEHPHSLPQGVEFKLYVKEMLLNNIKTLNMATDLAKWAVEQVKKIIDNDVEDEELFNLIERKIRIIHMTIGKSSTAGLVEILRIASSCIQKTFEAAKTAGIDLADDMTYEKAFSEDTEQIDACSRIYEQFKTGVTTEREIELLARGTKEDQARKYQQNLLAFKKAHHTTFKFNGFKIRTTAEHSPEDVTNYLNLLANTNYKFDVKFLKKYLKNKEKIAKNSEKFSEILSDHPTFSDAENQQFLANLKITKRLPRQKEKKRRWNFIA